MKFFNKKRIHPEQLPRRHRERWEKLNFHFDLLTAALAIVIIIASLMCLNHPYELGKPDPYGFAFWFLLFLGYLPMEIISLVNCCLGWQDTQLMHYLTIEQPAIMLGSCNLATLAIFWAISRFWAARRFGVNFLQTMIHFWEIFLVWGLFQLSCLIGLVIWDNGGFTSMHRHFARQEEPERVIIVKPEK